MKIYMLNGKAGSGKTTFFKLIEEKCRNYVYNYSTVDLVKKVAYGCGWNGSKTPENRKFLSDLKDLLTEWNDVPYKKIIEARDKLQDHLDYLGYDTNKGIIFTHCREPEEIKKFVDRENAITVLLRRAAVENLEQSNHADANVFNYEYDYIIENNGSLDELYEKAVKFLEEIEN